MNAVGNVAVEVGMPKSATHFERFAPPEATEPAAPAGSFTVMLNRSGKIITVAPEQSMLEALEAAGESLPFEDRSFDTVLATYTLCSVGAVERVLMRSQASSGGLW